MSPVDPGETLRDLLIVGPGRSGIALGLAVRRARPSLGLTYLGRRERPPDHPIFRSGQARYQPAFRRPVDAEELLVVAVPDDDIRPVAEALAGFGPPAPGSVVLHMSGSRGADALLPLHEAGYATGTAHPLLAIANPDRAAPRLSRAWFAVSGSPVALRAARALVRILGARMLEVPEESRARYHAAAVLVSNSLPALLATGGALLTDIGVDEDQARSALVPLLTSALDNVLASDPARALTGPVARGDVDTVRRNIASLEGDARDLYVTLARNILSVARRRLDPDDARALEALLAPAVPLSPGRGHP